MRRYLSAEEGGEEGKKGVDDMRRLLESSWNVETMGDVPTNADSAADAAVASINNAASRAAEAPPEKQIFCVDLLLPQYDIRQGPKFYDEVLAVEFCIKLARRLDGKSSIVVRDERTVRTVTRILDARGRDDAEVDDAPPSLLDDDDDEGEEEEEDFEDVNVDGGSNVDDPTSASVESFRERLIEGWASEVDDDDGSGDEGAGDENESAVEREIKGDSVVNSSREEEKGKGKARRWRLASMLGSADISSGGDMVEDVIRAVTDNAQPNDDEGTIIILSASSQAEMIGVRGLVGKYGGKRGVILVNCNLNPVPRELVAAETVYSIQPLVARPKAQPPAQQQQQAQELPQPKIVVMRRYPRDWEIFVDVGDGFELATTMPPDRVDKKGPGMEIIAGCVKAYLQSRLL